MRAILRFYAELKDFIAADDASGTVIHDFDVPGSVKDAIESHGVPHTEVDLILANGKSVDFSHRLRDGDRISVYPVFEAFDISPLVRLRPQPLRNIRFVLDGHLGKLARYLRLVGFDCVYSAETSDDELIARSTGEHRILLSRDVGLLKHGSLTHGYYVRSTDPRTQLLEIVSRFHLGSRLDPFSRCMACNGALRPVAKDQIIDRLPERTRGHYDTFMLCGACGKVYWQGAHYEKLRALVAAAQREDASGSDV